MLAANHSGVPLVESDGAGCPSPTARSTGSSAGTPCATSPTSPRRWPRRPGCCDRAGGSPCSRSTPRHRASGAPASTSGSTRSCPCSAAPSRTARRTATCRESVAYLPPAPVLRRMLLDAGFSAVGIRPLAGGLSQLVVAPRARSGRAPHDRRPPRPHRPARVRPRRPAVRRQPHRALRPARADPGRLGHRRAGGGERGRTALLTAIPCDDAVRRARARVPWPSARCPSPAPWRGTWSSRASPWGSPATPTA